MRLRIGRTGLAGGVLTTVLVAATGAQAQQYYPGQWGPGSQYGPAYAQPAAPSYPAAYPQGYAQPQYYGQSYSGQPGYSYSQPQAYPQQTYGQQPYAQPIYTQPQTVAPQPMPYSSGYAQGLNADQLEQLVAPIALYPDTLVAQVLAAATYPGQVADADQWLARQGNASPYAIAGGADMQSWDPSVKALTAFPQVLDELARNPRWMTDLGNAYYNQPQDVMVAVQVLRQRAQAAGNLESGPQETVSYDQGAIVLAPPSPQYVYVPVYNPWTVYGDPVMPYPGFSLFGALGDFFSTVGPGLLHFLPGIAMAAWDHTPFGWLSWAVSWLGHEIFFDHSGYASHSTTVANWGLAGGGLRAFAGYRPGSAWTGSRGPAYARTSGRAAPIERYGAAAQGRPQYEAYNRTPAPISRTESYAAPQRQLAYGPGAYNVRGSYDYDRSDYGSGAALNGGSSSAYRTPEAYRAPAAYGRGAQSYAQPRSYEEARSGGSHLFGGVPSYKEPKFKEPKEPKFKAPKEPKFKQPKMSGGGHSGGKHGW